MPAREIKELRQAGKLEEALKLAKSELLAEPDNIWTKRNISWVFYDNLKLNAAPEHFDNFVKWLREVGNLHLPAEEKILYDQIGWQLGKLVFGLIKQYPNDIQKRVLLFDIIRSFPFVGPSEAYSFLFKAFHKALKDTDMYIEFADWWGLQNFIAGDYQKERLPTGKEIMAIVEQAYISYAKHLLPKRAMFEEGGFNREKVEEFLPVLNKISEEHPEFLYPAYFQAKLLMALGDKKDMLSVLLPFARKKRNDFWVWDILAEAFSSDEDKVFACYCKALICRSPEEMLVGLRQRMAKILIKRNLYNEAKTEIELLLLARQVNEYKMPNEVSDWVKQDWFKSAISKNSNYDLYFRYASTAESILFSDIPEEWVIVEFVNKGKGMLNFISSESKFGFFKYDRFIKNVNIGDTLKVRFQGGTSGGIFQVYTAIKEDDEGFKKQFLREVRGEIKIQSGKPFGFLEDAYVHPTLISKHKLYNGAKLQAKAIKTYNQEKKAWSWKVFDI
jgi:hypothetical protein